MTLFEFLAAAAVTRIVAPQFGRFPSKGRDGVLMTMIVVIMIAVMIVIAIWTVHVFVSGRFLSGHRKLSGWYRLSAAL